VAHRESALRWMRQAASPCSAAKESIMSPWIILLVILVLALLAVVWAVSAFNGLVALRNRFANAFSQIDVQLKRRHDLIPNLVETARAYLDHERQTLEAVIAARGQAVSAGTRAAADPTDAQAMHGMMAAEGVLSAGLGRLLAVSEAYPTLKADTTMMQLKEELASTENRIAFARQAYNDAVMVYNTGREQVPTSLIANACNFRAATMYEIDDATHRQAPKVAFS
jgi:LemA protein